MIVKYTSNNWILKPIKGTLYINKTGKCITNLAAQVHYTIRKSSFTIMLSEDLIWQYESSPWWFRSLHIIVIFTILALQGNQEQMNKVIRETNSQLAKLKKERGRDVLLQSHCAFSTIICIVFTGFSKGKRLIVVVVLETDQEEQRSNCNA